MENPPLHETPPPTTPKKGMGPGAIIGIGCGAILLLLIIVGIILAVKFGGEFKEIAKEAETNPTRATALTLQKVSGGQMQFVEEDNINKRYLLKDSKGNFHTVYWNSAKNAPETIQGDFSAIPGSATPLETPPTPVPAPGE